MQIFIYDNMVEYCETLYHKIGATAPNKANPAMGFPKTGLTVLEEGQGKQASFNSPKPGSVIMTIKVVVNR